MSLFITGTDTGVGKTYIAVQLLRLARAAGMRCAGYKPICCGDRDDAELLLDGSADGLTIDEVNPIWLHTPAAPLAAAIAEKRDIDLALIHRQLASLQARFDFVVVEGVGGWLVPICDDYYVSHLATEMRLPVLVVALNRLGCLNHTMLTLQSIAASRLACLGVALNGRTPADIAEATNADILKRISPVPVLPGLSPEMCELPPEWQPLVKCQPDTKVSAL